MPTDAIRKFDAYIKAEGLKETAQRAAILNAFLKTEKHVSVDDIYALLKNQNNRVGYATVSRTMKLIAESGLAREVMFNDGVVRFEPTLDREHHHHLVCTKCKKVIEFSSPEMERGEAEILRQYDFEPEYHRYEIFGLCRRCREAEKNRDDLTSR